MSNLTKSEKWFGKKKQDLTKDELLEFCRLDERHKKLMKKDKEIEKYKKALRNTMQQLAEKEKAYQELLNSVKIKDLSNINFIQVNEDIIRFSESGVIYEYNKKENTIYKIIDQAYQDKISFAVEQLEKVKEEIDCYMAIREGDLPYNIECALISIADKIDNQIKKLKRR